MPDSRRELALQAIVAALDGAGKPAALTVHRFRLRPTSSDEMPAVVVYPIHQDSSRPTQRASNMQQDVLIVGLEFRVVGEGPDIILEPLVVWAEQALCGDRRLGGTVDDIALRSIDWGGDGEAKDQLYGIALMQFTLRLSARVGDPTTL